MLLLLPMDKADKEEGKLAKVFEASTWAQVDVEDGRVQSVKFSDTFDGFDEMSEAVVLENDFENPMMFLDYNMMPLVAHTQRNIDDIVEAYLFRELHDLAY
jgi:predicted Fe-Mo cluster-binding NifX family protein